MSCPYCDGNQGRGCPKCEGTLDEPIGRVNVIALGWFALVAVGAIVGMLLGLR